MHLTRANIILYLLMLGFILYIILHWHSRSKSNTEIQWSVNTSTCPYNVFSYLLTTITENRIRIGKLEFTSILGFLSMFIAIPASESNLPGVEWYNDLWNNSIMGGSIHVDEMISLSKCKQQDKTFVQIGAHLGIFPLIASYRNCRSIAVEPILELTKYIKISSALQNWSEDKFIVINAAGSDKSEGSITFDLATIAIAQNSTGKTKVLVPLTSLDAINRLYSNKGKPNYSPISFVIIDVEGHEQEVLIGAKQLIEEQTIIVLMIELWTKHNTKGNVTSFPGLALLRNYQYRIYTLNSNPLMNVQPCEDFTNRFEQLNAVFEYSCQRANLRNICLGEIIAIRSDVPEPNEWFSACGKLRQ